MSGALAGRVAVVTGGGGGIGSATSLELARQGAVVVAMDSGVGVHGEPLDEETAAQTVKLIEAEGGRAVASMVSVSDREAVQGLFAEVIQQFGSLDIVVNTAGFLRRGNIKDACEDDWRAVLEVHLNGYLNVLHAALPLMVDTGYGRVVGVTSGAGLARTSAEAPAYGCAKRAVAALTWQLGPHLPAGVAVNALSPIAATRMIRPAVGAAQGGAQETAPLGLDLSAMPKADEMAPAAAYLASDRSKAFQGQVVFSAGSELSLIAPPKLLEVVRSEGLPDFTTALGTFVPVLLAPAETQQRTGGGSNPRFVCCSGTRSM